MILDRIKEAGDIKNIDPKEYDALSFPACSSRIWALLIWDPWTDMISRLRKE